jgi:hypothetical protein
MTISVLLPYLLSISTGLALVLFCWPARRPIGSDFLLKFFLAVGTGFGVSSVVFFLCLFSEKSVRHLGLIEVLLLCSLIAVLCVSIAKKKQPVSDAPSGEHPVGPLLNWKIQWGCSLGFLIALGASLYASAALILQDPHGGWDAFAIWNLRARFLFRAGVQWRDAFSSLLPWSHTDYPLLLPASVARLWEYSGHESVAGPAILGLIFTYATVGLIVSAVAALRTRSQGFLAGLVLVSTPFFVQHGASQYADVPLGFFYLATIVLLCMQARSLQNPSRFLILAGVTAGLAAWTKNEGLMFLASFLVAQALVVVYMHGAKSYIRQLIPLAAGMVPILIIIVFFKLNFGGPSDIFSAPGNILHRLLDHHRYFQVSNALQRDIFDFGGWVVTAIPVLALYLYFLGGEIKSQDRVNFFTALFALLLTLAGYCVVYVIGPNDIQWWLSVSCDRLLLQLWPSAVFLFFLIVRTPEQAVSMGSRKRGEAEDLPRAYTFEQQ